MVRLITTISIVVHLAMLLNPTAKAGRGDAPHIAEVTLEAKSFYLNYPAQPRTGPDHPHIVGSLERLTAGFRHHFSIGVLTISITIGEDAVHASGVVMRFHGLRLGASAHAKPRHPARALRRARATPAGRKSTRQIAGCDR
jgi:hypothetical protein